jgi:DnaJ domain
MALRLTHLSRRRDSWDWDLTGGWYIRFTGDTDEWAELKDALKSWGRDYARWLPDYGWDDGKRGAWWIDDHLFRDSYTRCFSNLRGWELNAIQNDDTVQLIWRRGNPYQFSQYQHKQEQEQEQQEPPPRRIPLHLTQEYALLGVGASVTLKEVKDAYRALAKKYHPDAGGTHHGFITLQQAYERVSRWVEIHERIAV